MRRAGVIDGEIDAPPMIQHHAAGMKRRSEKPMPAPSLGPRAVAAAMSAQLTHNIVTR